jgi:thiamine pyrophosphokinase
MNLFAGKTVLLANGAFPTHPTPLAALSAARQIVCCDGAADRLAAAGFAPTWIVGDLDSLSDAARERYAGRLVQVSEQETNDLAKAFRFCCAHGWADLVILGATGLREDHALGNLALLADFALQASALLLTDTGWFTPLLTAARLPSFAGQQVSLIALDPRTSATAQGLKYPVDGLRLDRWWTATLNEASDDHFSVSFEGGPLLVFQTYGPGR